MPEDIASLMNASPTGQHLLLGEFVLPKAQGDPTTVTAGVTDGQCKFWVEDGRAYIGLYSTETGWTVVGEEPTGTIKPYVGLESDIPRGWHLCDGSNGTFDLRGYFILGSSLEDAGIATEATSAVLDDHPAEVHAGVSAQAHTNNTGTPSATTAVQSGSGTTVPTSTHTHALSSSHTMTQPDDHAAVAHAFTSEPTPASFTLAFIQKVS